MELRNFIKETLHQIAWGTNDAQKELPTGAKIAPGGLVPLNSSTAGFFNKNTQEVATLVEFDVAITTQEDTATKGAVGIFVVGVGLGSQGQSNSSAASSSRIKFSVPVHLPSS